MGSVFTGWLDTCTGTIPCQVFIDGNASVSATFAPTAIGTHTLDVDDNAADDALTDGLRVMRYLFGLTGTPLIDGATGTGAQRTGAAAILTYLDGVRPRFDGDGNGQSDALTDGLMIIRYLHGSRGAALIQGAVGQGAIRNPPVPIEVTIQSLRP